MRTTVVSATLLAMIFMMVPVAVQAMPADDCARVGAYVARVGNMIERAAPVIRQSGNERAMALLQSAVGNIRTANRAVGAGECRIAFNLAQQAERQVTQALRMINIRPRD